ncbi:Starch-binding associating with outer membrane [Chitinophaga sp. YR573]|uniref:RagB/SusD family nutrient uptake outer membrane protein n=1 Tax=Chitinophaga sp. YR573 TaxID=1881040 RepID=UPI0008AB106E|nr:RagB/SusD family nutrient uptake outer membrane protein [Chitinophaga sp. YR573]SEW43745.1 Starch-binding associating with outer membrane [Chitinophaga sp. YR573]
MKSLQLHKLAGIFLTVAMVGCTDLHEKVIDEVLGSNNSNPENAIAAAYGQMGDATFVDHGNVFGLQEYSTDEALLPTRGSDWGDGGVWRAVHEFTWGPDNSVLTNTWNNLNSGITKSLTAISSINNAQNFANKTLFLAEARGLLAFYTYHTLDLFGQAPYKNPFVANAPLEVKKADTAINGLIKEVEAILPDLANLKEQNTHNGRFTKQAAYALLADMYLNRAVFKDRYATTGFNFLEAAVDNNGTDMDKVIYYTSLLIDNPQFSLESNYFRNFDIDNAGRPELIFVVSQDVNTLRNSDNDFAYMTMERNQKPSPLNRGTNAVCTTPEFYATWNGKHDDPRFSRKYQYPDGTWFMNDGTDVSVPATSTVLQSTVPWFHFNRGLLAGQQYGPKLLNGGFEMTADNRIKVSMLYCEKNTSLPVDFTPELTFDNPAQAVFTQAQINRGVRVFKFEFDPERGSNSTSNVDIPLYRLGVIYCLRAEAYFRKSQSDLAMADINKLRTSRTREALYANAPGVAITSLDEQSLYNEIGYETYWEMYRRKQMIRFGKFDAAGTAKAASQPYRRIFPIPQSAMDASKAFTQNDKY